MKIVWSPRALERVNHHAEYIAADHPAAAERWVEGLFAAVQRLSIFPESGRPFPDVPRPDIREIVYRDSLVIYRTEPDRVVVLTVRQQRQFPNEGDLED